MGRKSAPIASRYGRLWGELLDMGARVAVRSYSHCPQTGRMYYKPPSAPSTADGKGVGAAATAAARRQQLAAPKVEFHASEFILYGGGQAARVHGGGGKEEPRR